MNRLRRGAVLLALACVAPLVWAGDVKISLTEQTHKAYAVEGVFQVKASSTVVWAVLTDYDHIPHFVPSMRESRVVGTNPDGSLIVNQEAVGSVLFFSKAVHVSLEVHHTDQILRFEDMLHKDFRHYAGSWETHAAGTATEVTYRLEAEPGFATPALLMRHGLKSGARDLLDQVLAEIKRRASN